MKWDSLSHDLKTRIIQQEPQHFNAGGIRAVQTKVTKPNQRSKSEDLQLVSGKEGVAFRISLIVVSRRRMDEHDNLRSACKPLVDAITESLGFKSDDDKRLTWNYHQVIGTGQQGTIVKIETTP